MTASIGRNTTKNLMLLAWHRGEMLLHVLLPSKSETDHKAETVSKLMLLLIVPSMGLQGAFWKAGLPVRVTLLGDSSSLWSSRLRRRLSQPLSW